MGKLFDRIDDDLAAWVSSQPVFFVGTAPLADDGHVNVSPKGLDGTFCVLDERRVAYLDLTGSGVETIAHLKENGRIVLMWCAFTGPPRIVRVHGRGEVVEPGDPDWDDLAGRFAHFPSARSVIVVTADRVSDSCGYGVPRMALEGERTQLHAWAKAKGPDGIVEYQNTRNDRSVDGLPGIRPRTEPASHPAG